MGMPQSIPWVLEIVSGETISDTLDAGRPYAFWIIQSEDPTAAACTFGLKASSDGTRPVQPVWNSQGVYASPTLPEAGGFRLLVNELFGAQQIEITLSQAAPSAGVTLYLYGYDSGITAGE